MNAHIMVGLPKSRHFRYLYVQKAPARRRGGKLTACAITDATTLENHPSVHVGLPLTTKLHLYYNGVVPQLHIQTT